MKKIQNQGDNPHIGVLETGEATKFYLFMVSFINQSFNMLKTEPFSQFEILWYYGL